MPYKDKEKAKIHYKEYHLKNRDKRNAYSKNYKLHHKDKCKVLNKLWYEKNREKVIEYATKRYKENKDKINLYHKEYYKKNKYIRWKRWEEWSDEIKNKKIKDIKRWRAKNRIKVKSYYTKYKSLKRGGGKLTIKTIQLVYEDNIKKYGTLTCYLCGKPAPFGKDNLEHKIPLSRGGTNDYYNLAIACRRCNSKKYNKTVKEYLTYLSKGVKYRESKNNKDL